MTFIIAIDGPAGAGKSTVARRVANALGFTYLDTGAMYRAVAWSAMKQGFEPVDEAELIGVARAMQIRFGTLSADGRQTVHVNGVDATEAIRSPAVTSFTSTISAIAELRRVVVKQQREIASGAASGVVLEGRDIGTVVFPNARLKVFLTASAEERARRRVEELADRGVSASYDSVLADQIERDARDSGRESSPLAAAADAVSIHTDGKSVDQVVHAILDLHSERASSR